MRVRASSIVQRLRECWQGGAGIRGRKFAMSHWHRRCRPRNRNGIMGRRVGRIIIHSLIQTWRRIRRRTGHHNMRSGWRCMKAIKAPNKVDCRILIQRRRRDGILKRCNAPYRPRCNREFAIIIRITSRVIWYSEACTRRVH